MWSGEAYLSYSLATLALVGFSVACFVSVNEIVYPSVFYGFVGSAVRSSLASVHAAFGFLALVGHLWHAYRARSETQGVTYNTFFDFMAKDVWRCIIER
ncbi:hypothetical protein [Egbenema bharatensis]|uniref:hypothetical protein n=1 Tax=Egbenema bharatensis TaxID=3463334 RepID=UPI003A869550